MLMNVSMFMSECLSMGVFMSVCVRYTYCSVFSFASRYVSTMSHTVFPCNISCVSECHRSESKMNHLHMHLGVYMVEGMSWLMVRSG